MRRNWLIYLLTFSLAVNGASAAALAVFWIQNHALADTTVGEKSIGSFLREDLNFTSEQASPILKLVEERKQEMIGLRAQMELTRGELMTLIASVPVNKDAVASRMEEIGRTQSRIRAIAVNTVIAMAEFLPPEARGKFTEYLLERGRACDVVTTQKSGTEKNLLHGDNRDGAPKGPGQ